MIRLWLRYPMSKAIYYLENKGEARLVEACVLSIGPVAFCICWRRKRKGNKQ